MNATPKHPPIPSSYHVCISAAVILHHHSCCRPYKLKLHLLPTSPPFATSPSLHLRQRSPSKLISRFEQAPKSQFYPVAKVTKVFMFFLTFLVQ